jgi:hypothetical protein
VDATRQSAVPPFEQPAHVQLARLVGRAEQSSLALSLAERIQDERAHVGERRLDKGGREGCAAVSAGGREKWQGRGERQEWVGR